MRAGLRTNQLDSSARYGHFNYVSCRTPRRRRPSAQRLGRLTKAKAISVIGSNITETNPLTAVRIKEAIRVYHSQVIVVDSATNIAQLASHPLWSARQRIVLDRWLVKSVIEQDLIDEASTTRHPQAFSALKQALAQVSSNRSPAQTGIAVEQIPGNAIFAEAPRAIAFVPKASSGSRTVTRTFSS